ncbi:MAG: SDR family oxidoreductase [Gemmatimonas sp.]|nr:SDR family oxidoreductase [Gemmatimonas sp.]
MRRLEGRVALVTGASRGIGLGVAKRFADEGARVTLMDIDEEALEEGVKVLRESNRDVLGVAGDVSNEADVQRCVADTIEQFGQLEILVNNAGVIRDNLIHKMSVDDWQTVMRVHLQGSFLCTQAAQKPMVERGYGRIINLSSTSALGNRGQANYATAKAGLQGLTRTLAIELGRFGITANAIAPGFIVTDMTRATAARVGVPFEEFMNARASETPVRRVGYPEDIAAAAVFFASEEAGFVTGQVLYVAGGPRG